MTGQMCIIYWAWNPSMEDLLQSLSYQKEPDGDRSSAVQPYAKESSKLMLETLKQGPKTEEDGKEDFLPTTTEIY